MISHNSFIPFSIIRDRESNSVTGRVWTPSSYGRLLAGLGELIPLVCVCREDIRRPVCVCVLLKGL